MQEVINCNLNSKTDWIDIVNLGIALINVIAVIFFFIIEKKKQKQEKINDYKLSWYKLIDIPERTKNISSILENQIKLLEEFKNNTETDLNKRKQIAQKLIIEFSQKIIEEKNIIVPVMKCVDENGNKELCNLLNNLREQHDTTLINNSTLNQDNNYSDFIDLKNTIIETYYKIGRKFL